MFSLKHGCSIFLQALFFWVVMGGLAITTAIGVENTPAARIVHFTGRVEILASGSDRWRQISAGEGLQVGDGIRTGDNGWAALLLADETMVQLNRGSLFIIKSMEQCAGWLVPAKARPGETVRKGSVYELKNGHIWLRNKNKEITIDIQTPLVTAGIRGTELDLLLAPDGAAYLSVLEGRVFARNDAEETLVKAFEQVVARPGRPFEKQLLLSPENTVQWIVHLPPLLASELFFPAEKRGRDIPLSLSEKRIWEARAALLDNNPGSAEALLSDFINADSPIPAVWIIHAQCLLLSGQYRNALQAAERAVKAAPTSVGALITKSHAHQGLFQLKEALEAAREAVKVAPDNAAARLTAGRLWFALDNTEAAKAEIAETTGAATHNLMGFIYFAEQDTQPAISSFEAALALDPGMAESYLGLALARMRRGEKPAAIAAMAAAMLLEPRRSIFLSYWGKMLHELGRPEKALDMLAQAAALDPADPTPWLYRAHILSDLNRAGEAIESIETAISKNDNRAVYRSRFLLDKDLAVKNITLARLYQQLGMGDWGQIKAVKSIKMDYANSAAHDFSAWTRYYLSGGKGVGDTSEWLKAFLFKSANANTLNTFNDYTLFYEQPNVGGNVELWVGNHDLRHGSAELHGAVPERNLSYQLDLLKYSRDQWKGGLYEDGYLVRPAVKWDISQRDHLSFRAHVESTENGDTATITKYHTPVDPANKSDQNFGQVELGYYRHMSSEADFLAHVRYRFEGDIEYRYHQRFFYSPNTYDYYAGTDWGEPYTVVQLLQLYRIQDHQLMFGTFQYWSDRHFDATAQTYLDYNGAPIPINSSRAQSRRTRRQESYYVQDVWHVSSLLTVEGALYADLINNTSSPDDTTWSDTYWNPRVGLLFTPTPNDTIKLLYARFLGTFASTARIDPVDVVGYPLDSLLDGANFELWSLGVEHEWTKGFVTARCFDQILDYDYKVRQGNNELFRYIKNHYQGIEGSFNQLLARSIGFNLGYILVHVADDESDAGNEGYVQMLHGRLSYLHPNGFYAGWLQQYHMVHHDNRPENRNDAFHISTIYIGYELPDKWGNIRLEVMNLFNEHFDGTYLSDLAGVWPETAGWISLRLKF